MRLLIALLLTACLAHSASAETWKVYVWPSVKTSKDHSYSPRFMKKANFEKAVRLADEHLRKYCDLRLQIVSNNRQANVGIYTANVRNRSYMYHRGYNAGVWDQKYSGIIVNDGLIPKERSGIPRDYYWHFVKDVRGLAGLILHELGHSNSILGRRHGHPELGETRDISHVLQANPPQATIDYLQQRFGRPQ